MIVSSFLSPAQGECVNIYVCTQGVMLKESILSVLGEIRGSTISFLLFFFFFCQAAQGSLLNPVQESHSANHGHCIFFLGGNGVRGFLFRSPSWALSPWPACDLGQ